jgi:hypothetical protein
MVPIEHKDWTEEVRASILGHNHPLDSTKKLFSIGPHVRDSLRLRMKHPTLPISRRQIAETFDAVCRQQWAR